MIKSFKKRFAVVLTMTALMATSAFAGISARAAGLSFNSTMDYAAGTTSLGSGNLGTVTVNYDITPTTNLIDGLVGYADSSTTVTDATSLALVIRTNTSGYFDVRNGDAYQAMTNVTYSANNTYHVKITANMSGKTYSVWVTPPNGSTTQIAQNYTFRSDAPSTDDLGQICVRSKTSDNQFTVQNHVITTTNTPVLNPNYAPGGNFDLSKWFLQLPTGSSGNINTVSSSALQGQNGYTNQYYFYTDRNDGSMVMMDPRTGWTTSGSQHPRTELHENTSGWSTSGTNILSATVKVTQVPGNTCIAQIFQAAPAPSKPLCELQYKSDGTINLFLENTNQGGGGTTTKVGSVPVGTKFTYDLKLQGTTITVKINGTASTFALPSTFIGENFYFKAGNYDQTATSGTPSTTPGTVVKFYTLTIAH
ncbi:polysaccharide lyase family 7 protein [Clostridium sp. YIM B02505]|uniref:Polysaccharide lyase family 7 protein n=1 Tax=Clostridium yunnanense TaxID=2800325 RepID=A0ABS1EMF3_9CLOT|nr:polysaccharide lyase family 7 protein [Clostridium yunnanense]MBK1810478.1 polysaccharide lyase family 7 protein [Clostridium yunnanense]